MIFNLTSSIFLLFLLSTLSCQSQHKRISTESPNNETELKKNLATDAPIGRVIRSVFQDSKGNLWFGGEGKAFFYDGQTINYFEGLKNENGKGVTIKEITEDKNGNIWFAHTGGISKYNNGSLVNYHEKDGLLNNDVWCIHADNKGVVWIGGIDGVCSFDGQTFKPFKIPKGKPDPTRGVTSAEIVHCIFKDSKNRLWFGTNGGAYCYDGETLKNIAEKDGLSNNFVGKIIEDKNGNIWFGTVHNGVSCYDGEQFIDIDKEGLLKDKEIWQLYKDSSNNIWITGKHLGIYKYDGVTMNHYNKTHGITCAGILGIQEDQTGNLWFTGISRIYRFDGLSFTNINENGPW